MVPERQFFNAELIRKRLGLSLQELTPELAQSFGFARVEGLLVAVLALTAFEVVALRFGADSRDGDDWFFRRHDHPGGAPRFPR